MKADRGNGEQMPEAKRPVWLSVIIPAFNEALFLPQTLASLQACFADANLNWTEPGGASARRVELIVVNDHSSDATAAIARERGARVIDVELRNIGAVRNVGAREATGEWLLFVDADTHVPKATFRNMIEAMETGAAGGGAMVDIDQRKSIPWIKFLMFLAVSVVWQRLGRMAAGCFMFVRRDGFLDFGGFDEQYFAAEEFFFTREVRKRGRFVLLNSPVLTSSRKLKSYTTWELVRFIGGPLLRGKRGLTSRRGLDVLYEGRR